MGKLNYKRSYAHKFQEDSILRKHFPNSALLQANFNTPQVIFLLKIYSVEHRELNQRIYEIE